jgi:predicted N-acetyltransferase YhbS
MITIRQERPVDESAREALLDVAYGPDRHKKPSARLRKGRLPAEGLALVAVERGRIIGTVRLWSVRAGGCPALLLGPLAVHPGHRGRGIGSALMRRALADAARLGHGAVLLVGDAGYYARFGFSAEKTGTLWLGAAVDPARLLAVELTAGALAVAHGAITASGRRIPILTRGALIKPRTRLIPRAA